MFTCFDQSLLAIYIVPKLWVGIWLWNLWLTRTFCLRNIFLHCNVVFHWLCAYTKWSLRKVNWNHRRAPRNFVVSGCKIVSITVPADGPVPSVAGTVLNIYEQWWSNSSLECSTYIRDLHLKGQMSQQWFSLQILNTHSYWPNTRSDKYLQCDYIEIGFLLSSLTSRFRCMSVRNDCGFVITGCPWKGCQEWVRVISTHRVPI